jgi:DSF synthase
MSKSTLSTLNHKGNDHRATDRTSPHFHEVPTSPSRGGLKMDPRLEPSPPLDLNQWASEAKFSEIDVKYDAKEKAIWQFMKFRRRPSVTLELLNEVKQVIETVEEAYRDPYSQIDPPVQYLVLASSLPGVFNLGGDLPLFVESIRSRDREGLRRYAHACVDVQYLRATNKGLPIQTISLVQGDALGGGFEAALADDVIIAEETAKFALPEILFNLFPGMGAYSFLARRINASTAEKLMLSGRIYSAPELHEMGVVDRIAEAGRGTEEVYKYFDDHSASFASRRAIFQSRHIVNPLSREELIEITDLWVEAALTLAPNDLRKMERLASAQNRRHARAQR